MFAIPRVRYRRGAANLPGACGDVHAPDSPGNPATATHRVCEDRAMSEGTNRGSGHGLTAVMRADERVMPLELFFDLVYVLAFTQCSTLMAETPTWRGVAQGMLVLAVMWWSWGGYAWLTSVV